MRVVKVVRMVKVVRLMEFGEGVVVDDASDATG